MNLKTTSIFIGFLSLLNNVKSVNLEGNQVTIGIDFDVKIDDVAADSGITRDKVAGGTTIEPSI